ncbi:MAG: tetratricopeptide repeat protein [Phycisphaerae bacterium]|nr:tetratricopeptide repeat protein [Phycisphaerae bacterium]
MGLTIGRIIILAAIAAGGYWAWTEFGQAKVENAQLDPYDKAESLFVASAYEKALTAYGAALNQAPSDPRAVRAKFRVARCLDQLRRYSEALKTYREFVASRPNEKDMVATAKERIQAYEIKGIK